MDVGANLSVADTALSDPDAIEILSNTITGNLACSSNDRVWDSSDESEHIYPRFAHPNTVGGVRSGQCVLASPAVEAGPLGPGPF